ncbi:hypothetical protein [Marinobacter sp.]|uniref:hypothetical protein n=1 Tax=Marinobacter sp. TaxID=50741 RepID=UPI001A086AF3|nr:hypothetical protein [Marinobacter sp.]MBE0485211.1 hypothetical protein [Marinobacter sp.]
MSSPINLPLSPSALTGLLATFPWLLLGVFSAGAAIESSLLLLAFLPPIGLLGWRSLEKHGRLRGSGAVTALQADDSGVLCQLRDGRAIRCQVDSSSSIGPSFVILKLQPEGTTSHRMMVLITGSIGPFRANVPDQDFRRLRMWLRINQPSRAH